MTCWSKPRASGDDPEYVPAGWDFDDVNPARAGMIRASYAGAGRPPSKPRASGDDPHAGGQLVDMLL